MEQTEQPQQGQHHTGLIITLIIIIILCAGVMLYLLNLLPSQVADLIIKPTSQVTSSTSRFVENTKRKITDFGTTKKGWPDEPFSPPLANHVWRVDGDDLFGLSFDDEGRPLYFIHGIKGAYSYNDVPLDGEHVYWLGTDQKVTDLNELDPGSISGYWLRFTAIQDINQPWGKVVAGQVDFKYQQTDGHGLLFLNMSSIKKE